MHAFVDLDEHQPFEVRRRALDAFEIGHPFQHRFRFVDDAAVLHDADVGLEAADTVGNAAETARWAEARGYDRLIVVTSDYHMPRALLELQAAMPDTRLVAYAVPAPAPWSSASEARRWMTEYFKYAAVFAREQISGR